MLTLVTYSKGLILQIREVRLKLFLYIYSVILWYLFCFAYGDNSNHIFSLCFIFHLFIFYHLLFLQVCLQLIRLHLFVFLPFSSGRPCGCLVDLRGRATCMWMASTGVGVRLSIHIGPSPPIPAWASLSKSRKGR